MCRRVCLSEVVVRLSAASASSTLAVGWLRGGGGTTLFLAGFITFPQSRSIHLCRQTLKLAWQNLMAASLFADTHAQRVARAVDMPSLFSSPYVPNDMRARY
jgi:hypothetical protein